MQAEQGKKWNELRARLFKMVSVGVVDDPINQGYDIISTLMLIVNLVGAFANTFDGIRAPVASHPDPRRGGGKAAVQRAAPLHGRPGIVAADAGEIPEHCPLVQRAAVHKIAVRAETFEIAVL